MNHPVEEVWDPRLKVGAHDGKGYHKPDYDPLSAIYVEDDFAIMANDNKPGNTHRNGDAAGDTDTIGYWSESKLTMECSLKKNFNVTIAHSGIPITKNANGTHTELDLKGSSHG